MNGSSCRSLEVFDFKEEDELPEFVSGRFSGKSRNPNAENPAILKYNFLECVAQGTNLQTKEVHDVPCVDIDEVDSDHVCDNANPCTPPAAVGDNSLIKEGKSVLDDVPQSSPTSHEQHLHFKVDNHEPGRFLADLEMRASSPGEPSPERSQLNCALVVSPSSSESVDAISDADDSMKESSSSTPASEFAANNGGCTSDQCLAGWDMDDLNMVVVICPDFVMHRDSYSTDAQITFSSNCIKIKGSDTYGKQGTFSFQWGVDDIVDIECQCFERVETATIKLHVISKDAVEADDIRGTSGIEELTFAVCESNWSEKQEKIKSLDVRYKAVWNVVFGTHMRMDDGALLGQNIFVPKRYFPNFDESFEEVVYPKEDSDPVSIGKRDVDLLQPETFINDTIIDFYIKYLKNKIQPEETHRFHFFNSFFFRKLADLDKDPFSASEGRAAFLRVRKWTRKVNLFEKDYIFIPVNFNLHWSLIVICHPGEVANFKDEDINKALKVPCILHMDSIKGTHTGLKNHVQSYLWEEWKEKQNETSEDICSKFLNLRFVPLELPQQENSFDCGLFLLHYAELFLEEAPVSFSPFKITKFSNFLNVDWFPPAEASLKRAVIQRLIYELLENGSREISPASCTEEHQSSKFPEHNSENENDVEFILERCSPAKACRGNLSNCQAGQGLEMTLLAPSSMRSSQFVNDPAMVLREFFEPEATPGSLLDGQYRSFDQTASFYQLKGAMTPIEEEAETDEHFVHSPSGGTSSRAMAGITPHSCSIPYSSRDFGARTSWLEGIPMEGEHEDADSSPETSICDSDDSLDVGIIENGPIMEGVAPSQKEKTNLQRTPSMENIECFPENLASASGDMVEATVNEDLQNPDKILDSDENEDPLPSCQKDPLNSLSQDSDMDENRVIACDGQNVSDDLVLESEEQQPAKRLRLTPPLEEERRLSRNLSNDLHL